MKRQRFTLSSFSVQMGKPASCRSSMSRRAVRSDTLLSPSISAAVRSFFETSNFRKILHCLGNCSPRITHLLHTLAPEVHSFRNAGRWSRVWPAAKAVPTTVRDVSQVVAPALTAERSSPSAFCTDVTKALATDGRRHRREWSGWVESVNGIQGVALSSRSKNGRTHPGTRNILSRLLFR